MRCQEASQVYLFLFNFRIQRKDVPAAIIAAVKITFLAESFYLLLNGGAVYRQLFCHLREGDKWFVAQKCKQATTIFATELDALPVVPPSILVGIADNVYLALHFFAYRLAEECKERSDLTYLGMSSIGWNLADFLVRTVQGLQIFSLFTVADNYHGPSVTGHDIVHHQSRYASVAVLERMYAYIAVMKQGGQLHR